MKNFILVLSLITMSALSYAQAWTSVQLTCQLETSKGKLRNFPSIPKELVFFAQHSSSEEGQLFLKALNPSEQGLQPAKYIKHNTKTSIQFDGGFHAALLLDKNPERGESVNAILAFVNKAWSEPQPLTHPEIKGDIKYKCVRS